MSPRNSPERPNAEEALQRRDAQFAALNRMAAVISQAGDLEKALDGTLDELLRLTGADIGTIHVLEAGTGALLMCASRGVSSEFVKAEECIPPPDCLCGRAASEGRIISSPDMGADPRMTRMACRKEQMGSVISIPLQSRERVMGVLTLYSKRTQVFSDADEQLLTLVGHQIGVAIENAQLYARTRDLAVLEERGLIAREIHDGIAQSLAYLNLETKKLEDLIRIQTPGPALAELDEIRQVIKDTYSDVRELLVDFRTKFKEGEGFIETVSRYAQEFSRRAGVPIAFNHPPELPPLPPSTLGPLFRVIQEGLANVRKHAAAKNIILTAAVNAGILDIRIQDDGQGFDKTSLNGTGQPMGLEIMRDRVAGLHGDIRIDSGPGRGTLLVITVPLAESAGRA
ncbi:MAG TPA: GAF domain-containing protein [Nitrospiria bacterium]